MRQFKSLLGIVVVLGLGYAAFHFYKVRLKSLEQAAAPAAPLRFDQKFDEALKDLKIEDVKVGTGAVATRGKKITAHYTGRLMDGKVFDSTVARKQPIAFPLGVAQGLPGWDRGLVGMRVGGRRKLVIPSFLAYGEKGVGSLVPPGATVQFEFELLKVGEADDPISIANAKSAAQAASRTIPAKPAVKKAGLDVKKPTDSKKKSKKEVKRST